MPRLDTRSGPKAGDSGETLIELLVTIVVMGIAVVAILGTIATTITMSVTHRRQATAGAYVRADAESVETNVAASPTAYTACAQASAYTSGLAGIAPYTRSVTVEYWNGTAFVGTCGSDQGVQRVTVTVSLPGSNVTETLSVIIRRPCRSTEIPADTACS